MSAVEIIILAIGLAMDAFAVSICKGMSEQKPNLKHALLCGIYFGVAQAIMPLLGYFLGSNFASLISKYDHWVAFVLLSLIGINMIKESREADETYCPDFSVKQMFILAIATSIDALAVGISFAFLQINIVFSVIAIGVITFVLSTIGERLGNVLGSKFKRNAELMGGIILIFIGLKILLEHLGII